MNKPLKNFSVFLKENWTDKLEEFVDDVVEDDNSSNDNVSNNEMEDVSKEETAEETAPTAEVEPVEPEMHTMDSPMSTVHDDKLCNVVFLCGVVATMGKDNPNAVISGKLKSKLGEDCKEVQLFQLNIQPASEGEEPMDGMVQVYDAVKDADAIVVCSDLKKGQISSVLQATLERLSNHFKTKELRNKVFGTVITGQEDAYQSVKSTLLNFANNMGMIVGGDCNVFCCISEGESLGDCQHNYEADTTNAATCIKELCFATATIRGAVDEKPATSIDVKPISPISSVLNFDDFDNKVDSETPVDTALEVKDGVKKEPEALKNFDEFEGEEEDFEDGEEDSEDDNMTEEEEEGYYYDYNNDICHNRTETPMSKPNPVKLTKESCCKNCGCSDCKNGNCTYTKDKCTCKKANESKLLNFDSFLKSKK
jgi:NAD(P)H-dependent FMN reductase